jgi:VWFA-related protein
MTRSQSGRRVALALAIASCAWIPLHGRQQTPPAPVPPLIRAGVEQVVVDVVVTDASGQPATELSAADFTVLEDGKAQRIDTFQEVSLPVTLRAAGSAPPAATDLRTNRQAADGRVYVLLLDDYFVMAARSPGVQQLAGTFLDRYVQPGDLVAVATTSGMVGGTQAFTDDMRLVRKAVDRFTGKKSRSATIEKLEALYRAKEMDPARSRRMDRNAPTFNRDGAVLGANAIDDELLDRGRVALRTVKGVVQALAGVGGRRKALLYVSEGIDIPLKAGDNADVSRELSDVFAAAARANVAVYPLDPRGLHGMGDEIMAIRAMPTAVSGEMPAATMASLEKERRTSADMLRSVAEGTGGIAAVETNDPAAALERVVAENSRYYLLGYPSPAKRDGRYHALDVKVLRPGLQVRARKGYTAPDDKAPRVEGSPGFTPELSAFLRRPLPSSGLPLTAQAVVFPGTTDNVSVTVEIGPGALAFAAKGDKQVTKVDIAILPVDAGGRTHALAQGHPQLTLDAAMAETVKAKGLRLSHRLTLAPGDYQLRIAVGEQTGGATGSLLCDVTVPDPAAPGLRMTPILASSTDARTLPSAYNDPGLLRALGGPPTTARAFATSETLSAYVELIDAGATAMRDVDIRMEVRDPQGRVVARHAQPKANGTVAAGQSFAYAIDLPLEAFAAGSHVLTISARAPGLSEPVARELAFAVRKGT